MSRHDDRVSLRQMLDYLEEAVQLARGHERADLDGNRMLFLSVLKLVELVGEAATRVSETTVSAHPHLPWREITATRNRLIHGYDSVDCDILWDIVTVDFPPLAAALKLIVDRA